MRNERFKKGYSSTNTKLMSVTADRFPSISALQFVPYFGVCTTKLILYSQTECRRMCYAGQQDC